MSWDLQRQKEEQLCEEGAVRYISSADRNEDWVRFSSVDRACFS